MVETLSSPGYALISRRRADVTGDGRPDIVTLYGRPAGDGESRYVEGLHFSVRSGRTGSTTVVGLPPSASSGYGPSLWTGDLTGNGVADVLVTAETGGSGNFVTYAAYSMLGNRPRPFLRPEVISGVIVRGEFLDGYRAIATITETAQTDVIDIIANKEYYDALGVYKDGELLVPVELWSPPFVGLKPVPVGPSKRYDLLGIQNVKGVNNSDNVAGALSWWRWNGNRWRLTQAELEPLQNSITPEAEAL